MGLIFSPTPSLGTASDLSDEIGITVNANGMAPSYSSYTISYSVSVYNDQGYPSMVPVSVSLACLLIDLNGRWPGDSGYVTTVTGYVPLSLNGTSGGGLSTDFSFGSVDLSSVDLSTLMSNAGGNQIYTNGLPYAKGAALDYLNDVIWVIKTQCDYYTPTYEHAIFMDLMRRAYPGLLPGL